MKHKMLGTLTWQKDQRWHVNLFDGKDKEQFASQEEAVKFVEDHLISIMDDYGFEVCYRVENQVLNRRSYVLIERNEKGKIIHTSLSRYEYAKTHFFFYSKDKRRKIIDYKNPTFNQLTRHCISTRSSTQNIFIGLMSLALVFLTTLLILFVAATNNYVVQAANALPNNGSHDYDSAMLGVLITMLGLSVSLFGTFLHRYFKYKSLVRSGSSWHESYSDVDWRRYYLYVKHTRPMVTFLTAALFATTLAFGIIFSESAMFDTISYQQTNNTVSNMFTMYIVTLVLIASFGSIATYNIIRFRVSLYHIAPVLLNEEGDAVYAEWLKGKEVSKEEEANAFHPVEEHLLYPNAEIINENPKLAILSDEQVKQLRKDIKTYQDLIMKDRFGKHPVDAEVLAAARSEYSKW